MKALICGSFDPVTNGHIELIRRTAPMFEETVVGIFVNPDKSYFFTETERISMLREATQDIKNVRAELCSGYVADYCKENGIGVIVKGIRNEQDYLYELEMARFNKQRNPLTETVFLPAYGEISEVSSTLVRSLYEKNENISKYVPKCVLKAFESKNCSK